MKIPEFILNQINQIEGGNNLNIVPIMNVEGNSNTDDIDLPQTLPILALRDAVLFPGTIMPITIGREKSIKLVKALYKTTKIIGTVTQIEVKVEDPKRKDLYDIGTSAKILKIIELPDGSMTALLQGIKRFKLIDIISSEPYLIGVVEHLEEKSPKKNDPNMDVIS